MKNDNLIPPIVKDFADAYVKAKKGSPEEWNSLTKLTEIVTYIEKVIKQKK